MHKNGSDGQFLSLPSLVGGGITVLCALLTRLTTGSPLAIIHKLDAADLLPPLWMMGLLWLASYALVGIAAGHLLFCHPRSAGREAYIWRGETFAVLAVVFSLVWYTLLFGKLCIIPSWLCLLLSIVAALICAFSWWHVWKWTAMLMVGFTLWQVILFFLQFAVIMHV